MSNQNKEFETRVFQESIQVEKRDDGPAKISGYAAVFEELSQPLGGFREIIEPGAFDEADMEDVVCVKNHNVNFLLARTRSNTLSLSLDKRGFRYEFENPGNSAGNDLIIEIERGDIYGSSFMFRVADDRWEEDKEGRIIRYVKKISVVRDVGPVVFPAYQQTEVTLRSLDAFKKQKQHPEEAYKREAEARQRRLRLLQIN
ncbi:HK97 family phage prohead protease [Rapidithrix thailandica]|uniref:HK97 family phage prohead protease n=1 Tax=Rapidithrix thailandica TaxID=413964 RepID=A0AAW9SEN5_9BACT